VPDRDPDVLLGFPYLEFPPRTWSARWFEAYFYSREWREATVFSVEVATLTTVLATIFGTLAAYGLYSARGIFATVMRGTLMLPMPVPLILVAIGAFFVYAKINLNSTITGLVLAHTVPAIPFVMVAVGNGLKTFDMNQERVARAPVHHGLKPSPP
jgi:putative spermidine/putrescine transport system permease protein